MLCKFPYMLGVIPCGCGRCLPCTINRRRIWTHRILLESMSHGQSSFVTLTYDDDHVPRDGSLRPIDMCNWLKRLRKEVAPRRLRYYVVGEYGDDSWRPHYHGAIFGLSSQENEVVKQTWGKGNVYCGDLTFNSAQYIARYVTKKLTDKEDLRLWGKYPEFSRMSRKPGIGAHSVQSVARTFLQCCSEGLVKDLADVPGVLRHGKKLMPLGRYLKGKFRENLGLPKETPVAVLQKYGKEMRELLQAYVALEGTKERSPKHLLIDMNRQAVLNLESKTLILDKGKKI